MNCLEVRGLSKFYRNGIETVEALRQIDLVVREGEFVAVLGPSGCGKTTLLLIVAGLERPTAGEVRFRGRPVLGWGRERTLIFQEQALFPWLTAQGNVEFGLRMLGMPREKRRERALDMLRQLGLEDFARAYPHQLSGGMQQRVALARALAVEPDLLLMDEPFAAVDALTRRELQEELRRLTRTSGQTVLLVTHSVREALFLADRLILLTPRPGRVYLEVAIPRPLAHSEMGAWEEKILSRLALG
ncbi:MAG: ABC transporter ATP-binding protein [Chloroflexia bacterium]